MADYLIMNQNFVNSGTGTLTFTVPTTGNYNCQVQFTEAPPSSIVMLLKKNGSTVYTAPTIGQTQSAQQFKTSFQAAAADSMTVVYSAAAGNDLLMNNVKSNVSIGQGL